MRRSPSKTGADMAKILAFTGLSRQPKVLLNARPAEVVSISGGCFQIALF
jgi:hypothetical protein